MSARLTLLAQRKELLLTRLQLQRLETRLRAAELREALRPASLLGGAIAQPAAVFGLIETVAPLLGLRRLAKWTRVAAIAVVAFRLARTWRGRAQPAPAEEAPAQPPPTP